MEASLVIFYLLFSNFEYKILAHFIAELPESAGLIHQEEISSYYNSFIREKPDASPTSSSSVK